MTNTLIIQLWQLWIFACVYLTFGALPGVAEEFVLQSLPLPINVDGQRIRSSLYLQLEVKQYGVSLDTFLARPLDAREAVFAQVMSAIRARDYERILSVWETPKQPPLPQKDKIEATENLGLENYVNLYRAVTKDFQRVTIVSQALVGSKSIFIWEAETERGPLRRAFSVQQGEQKPLTLTPVRSSSPVEFQLIYFMEETAKSPDAYRPALNLKSKYRYRLPVEGDSEHPVYFQFDGEFVDFDVFDTSVAPPNSPHSPLSSYGEAYLAYKNRNFERFITRHTSKSQEKLKQWYATMKPGNFEQYYALTTQGRHIYFLLNADPVYIVFYSVRKMEKFTPRALRYDYLVQDPHTATSKLTNVFFESFLDDILKNEKLFDLSTLKGP